MEWNEEAETLLKLDKIEWAYYRRYWGVSCVVDLSSHPNRGPHKGKLTVIITEDRTSFAVACDQHLHLYLSRGWVLYD